MSVTKKQMSLILEMSRIAATHLSPGDCPFCGDWEQRLRAVNQHIPLSEGLKVTLSQFQHHLGGHMQQLALFAIPRGHTEKGDADSGSAAASKDTPDSLQVDDINEPSSDLVEDMIQCQNVLEDLLSAGPLAEHFSQLPDIPVFSMYRYTAGEVKVSPLNLEILSQKLASGIYRTAKDFQLDLVLMFAMHRITRTNEKDFYSDTKVAGLFTRVWNDSLSLSPSAQVVETVELKMRHLFYNSKLLVASVNTNRDTQAITFVMPDGKEWQTYLPISATIRDLYMYAECSELLENIDKVPIVARPDPYTDDFLFTISGPNYLSHSLELLSIDFRSHVSNVPSQSGPVKVFIRNSVDPTPFGTTREEDDRDGIPEMKQDVILGPKLWTGTQFLPRFIGEEIVENEGLCYFYDDGTHCGAVIDGEPVNAYWGVTKAGKPRKRLAIACITCREKKIKCDPDYPRCVQCESFGRICRFKNE